MSAHEWPEFDEHLGLAKIVQAARNGDPEKVVALTEAQYNYAKVRIDGYEALQQRCEELVSALEQAEMDVEAIKLCLHPRDASFTQVAISKIRHSLSKQVQP